MRRTDRSILQHLFTLALALGTGVLCAQTPAPASSAVQNSDPWPPTGVVRLGPGVASLRPTLSVSVDLSDVDPSKVKYGTVGLEIVIEADGTVALVRVVASLDPLMDRKAAEAVRKWRFAPPMQDGHAVRVLVPLPFPIPDPRQPMKEMPPSWPMEFSREGANGGTWATETRPHGLMTVTLPIPPDWHRNDGLAPDGGAGYNANDYSVAFVIHPPSSGLAIPDFVPEAFITALLPAIGNYIHATRMGASGHVRVNSQHFVWFEAELPVQSPDYAAAFVWIFITSVDASMTQVQCLVPRPTGDTEAALAKRKAAAGLVCGRMIREMVFAKK